MAASPGRSSGDVHDPSLNGAEQQQQQQQQIIADAKGRLDDDYILRGEEFGRGRYGVVRTCVHRKLGRVLACKSIQKRRLKSAQQVEELQSEISVMKAVSGHPFIVQHIAVYEDEDSVDLVMELCLGGDLFNLLSREDHLSEADVSRMFSKIVDAVRYCHSKNIMHRDIKPENILLTPPPYSSSLSSRHRRRHSVSSEATESDPKLADFGLAVELPPGTKAQGLAGSFYYMAPEVIRGDLYSFPADVWSLGVLLYVMLSGMLPFWGEDTEKTFERIHEGQLDFSSRHWSLISSDAKSLIRWMCTSDASLRPSLDQVLLHPWLASASSSPAQTSPSTHATTADFDPLSPPPLASHQTSKVTRTCAPQHFAQQKLTMPCPRPKTADPKAMSLSSGSVLKSSLSSTSPRASALPGSYWPSSGGSSSGMSSPNSSSPNSFSSSSSSPFSSTSHSSSDGGSRAGGSIQILPSNPLSSQWPASGPKLSSTVQHSSKPTGRHARSRSHTSFDFLASPLDSPAIPAAPAAEGRRSKLPSPQAQTSPLEMEASHVPGVGSSQQAISPRGSRRVSAPLAADVVGERPGPYEHGVYTSPAILNSHTSARPHHRRSSSFTQQPAPRPPSNPRRTSFTRLRSNQMVCSGHGQVTQKEPRDLYPAPSIGDMDRVAEDGVEDWTMERVLETFSTMELEAFPKDLRESIASQNIG